MSRILSSGSRRSRNRRRTGRRIALIAGPAIGVEAAVLHHRSAKFAGEVIVRCRSGHLFTTIWIPGVSLKSIRLGPWRVQRCPVGHHFSLVTPVGASELTEDERRRAREVRDIRLP